MKKTGMKDGLRGIAAIVCGLALAADAGEFTSALVGRVTYDDTPGWTISAETKSPEKGLEEWSLTFVADKPGTPPRTKVRCGFPAKDIVGRWSTGFGFNKNLPAGWQWSANFSSSLYSQAPVLALFSSANENRGVIACSEALRKVNFRMGIDQGSGRIGYSAELFSEPEAPLASCKVRFRLELRPVLYADAVRGAFAWYGRMPAYRQAAVPEAAFDPLYSFWYSYNQHVGTACVEKECAAAVPYGMKTAIVDDGWQTDKTGGGYVYCGDWEVSTNRFADFPAHVKRVQAMGMKYMLWFSVPHVGFKSANYPKFKGKYLYEDKGMGAAVLDPRFPEVREFLIGHYERAIRDWGLDGLKLDFIDFFSFRHGDPAVKENYAGRDIKSLPEAIDRLMTDVNRRLTAIKPDMLIEFRQSYVGPAIRKYGNMFRAMDCPMDSLANRVATIDLRLSSGNAAVHSDMLMWNWEESPEAASKQFWNILFSVPQISVRLKNIPAAQQAKLHEMLAFWIRHRETLMKGELRPLRPDLNYPVVYAYGKGEQVVAVYDSSMVVEVDRSRGRAVYIVNATDAKTLVVREGKKARVVKIAPCSAARLD